MENAVPLPGSRPLAQILIPRPLGETSAYVSKNRSMIGCAHGFSSPASSRQSSKSIPKNGSEAEKTKPTPAQRFGFSWHALSASSQEHHVLESVLLAQLPLVWCGIFVALRSEEHTSELQSPCNL